MVSERTRELVPSNYKLANKITERKQIEIELRKSETKFRNILNSSTVLLWQ